MLPNEIIEQYQGLIFDMDGTVVDTMPSHAKAWVKVGEHFGYPFDDKLLYEMAGAPVDMVAKAQMQRYGMPIEHLPEVIAMKRELGQKMIMEHSTLLPAAEIVRSFFGKKLMALGTGSYRGTTEMLLNKFDFAPYFNAIVTAEDVAKHKPAPDTFLRCAELIGVQPHHCLVFEDADLGIEAALRGGMHAFDVRSRELIKG